MDENVRRRLSWITHTCALIAPLAFYRAPASRVAILPYVKILTTINWATKPRGGRKDGPLRQRIRTAIPRQDITL